MELLSLPVEANESGVLGRLICQLTECVGAGQVGNGGPRAVRGTSWEAVLMVHK